MDEENGDRYTQCVLATKKREIVLSVDVSFEYDIYCQKNSVILVTIS